jgi:hypothetical protein
MPLAQSVASDPFDAHAARRLGRLLNPAPVFAVHAPGSAARPMVERFITARFRAVHGASVSEFMPALLTMACGGGLTAAAGVRAAQRQPLFLEQYLSLPVEQALARLQQQSVQRAQLVEIGNLVTSQGGSSYLLFLVLAATLERAGFEWVVFTATAPVRKALVRLGLETHGLGDADPARLTRSPPEAWGSYYASRPRVVAGKIADAMAVLHRRRLYASVLTLFNAPIETLSETIAGASVGRGTCTFAA